MRAAVLSLLAVAAAISIMAVVREARAPGDHHEILRDIYMPTYARIAAAPPVSRVAREAWDHFKKLADPHLVSNWLPTQVGVLWLSLIVAIAIAWNLGWKDPRLVDLLALQLLGVLLFNVLGFFDRLEDPASVALMRGVFVALVVVSLFILVHALWLVIRPVERRWVPALPFKALVALALVLFGLDVLAAAVHPPDDAGYFVNLGAQRLRERHLLPYGDPLLTGTPGAAYGPLLYVAHLPFQIAIDPHGVNAVSSPLPPLGAESTYRLPAALATKLCVIALHTIGVVALFSIGRRYGSREIAWALVALYCAGAGILGVGGDQYFIGGMTFVSHIGPAAVLLAAFALLHRPAASGALLVAAAGCGFFPAFLAPAWLAYFWDAPKRRWRFLAGLVVAGVLLGAFILLLSRPAHGRGLIGTILWDTFGHHSDPAGYGFSPFGFWGQRGGIIGWLARPLVGTSGLTAPTFLIYLALSIGGAALTRRRDVGALALVSAAIVIASNLIKVHATGTYIAWFYGLLLVGLVLPRTNPPRQNHGASKAQ